MPPRVFVARPQRAPTALVLMIVGVLFAELFGYVAYRETRPLGVPTALAWTLGAAALPALVALFGLHSWRLRVTVRTRTPCARGPIAVSCPHGKT